jgi:predicted lysophospholipase L1 biosynthesis ABC-type transport system permease subunit
MRATLVKLAFAGIRSRLLASVLTILVSSAAAATIVLALEVGQTARDPWQRTFDAANGAHVLANVPSQAGARAIAALPGVAERDEPVPIAPASVASGGGTDRLLLAGLRSRARVNSPVRTEGAAPPADGIVLERSFAGALGLRVGGTLRLAAEGAPIELPIVGTAISPSQPRYPRSNPGLAWVTRGTLARIAPDRSRWSWNQAIRLEDRAAAPAFAERAAASLPPGAASVQTWEDQRAEALREAQPITVVLTTYTIVLLVVVFAVVAILVGARASAQYREIGLLKAVGLTPRQVTAVFVLETAALGLISLVIGFALGALLAPRLAAPSAETMLGSPTTAASPWHLLLAGIPVLLVLVAGARSSTRRSTRFTVLHAIQSGAPSPAPRSRWANAIARAPLPLPLALGFKDLLARRRRALRLGGAIAVTGAAIVFALSMKASLDAQPAGEISDVTDELPVLVYTLDAVLLVITTTSLVALALLSVRERIRDYGVLKTVGLTPGQIASSLVGAHAVLALIAALLSIPIGIALFRAAFGIAGGDGDDLVIASWWSLTLVPIGTLLVVAGATSLPARLATRIPTADALRYE